MYFSHVVKNATFITCSSILSLLYVYFHVCRFKIKYHPEDSVKRKDEQMNALKVFKNFTIELTCNIKQNKLFDNFDICNLSTVSALTKTFVITCLTTITRMLFIS